MLKEPGHHVLDHLHGPFPMPALTSPIVSHVDYGAGILEFVIGEPSSNRHLPFFHMPLTHDIVISGLKPTLHSGEVRLRPIRRLVGPSLIHIVSLDLSDPASPWSSRTS